MSLLQAARIDKQIIAHLTYGGSLRDSVGLSLVNGFLRESLQNSIILETVKYHNITKELLREIYISGYENIPGSPLIEHGGAPILIPSLIFIDDINFPTVFDSIVLNFCIENEKEMIIQQGIEFFNHLQGMASIQGTDMSWPPDDWPTLSQFKLMQQRKGCGCLPIFILSFILYLPFLEIL
jgi:hypothetical protein